MRARIEPNRVKEINHFELNKLRNLEESLHELIPKLHEIQDNSFGYVIEDNHIVALGLYNKEVYQLRSHDLNFPFLKKLILRNFKTRSDHIWLVERNLSRYSPLWQPAFTKGIIELPCLEYLDLTNCTFNVQYFINRIPSLKYINLTGVNLLESQKKKLSRGGIVKIESMQLKPDLIYNSLIKKEIIKSEAIYQLKTLLERTNITSEGIRCIEILKKISISSPNIFEILENCLVAFTNPYYRAAAAKAIICKFLKRGHDALTLIIERESSVLILTIIYQFLEKLDNNISRNLMKKLVERYAHSYNLLPDEAQFFLDLHIESLNDYSTNFALKNIMIFRGEVKHGHVTSLNLSGYNYLCLPDSIGNLSMLESLDLQCNMFQKLPDVWNRLKNLESLDLSNNKFLEEIPESLKSSFININV